MSESNSWKLAPNTRWQFHIDLIGGCNLACPSCPVGNSRDVRNSKGYMSPELLDAIVSKAISECGMVDVGLYNWSEPLLHPDLAKMIRVVHSHGASCTLSTNLNNMKNIDQVLQESPGVIKISLSGFFNDKYDWTHKNGDIEVVKINMAELADIHKRVKSSTAIVVGFHRYFGNHKDEFLMQEYAESLGFNFLPQWAYLMPLEKILDYIDSSNTGRPLTSSDQELIDILPLPLDKAIEISKNSPPKPCQLRDKQMALTEKGEVMLCCVVYDQAKYSLGSYLDHTLDELQKMKYAHMQCRTCMENGLHKFFTYEDQEYDDAAHRHVLEHFPGIPLREIAEFTRGNEHSFVKRFALRVKGKLQKLFLSQKNVK